MQRKMAVESLILLKLKLLLASGAGGGHCHLHVALLWFFLLKLPLAARMRAGSYANMALTMRLFCFRLSRVLFSDTGRNGRRWERALRLLWERAAGDGRSNEDSLHALSMLAL